jgi:lysozyme family protein
MDFDTAFQRLIGHEGGYVNDPRDPGGETKYGISRRSTRARTSPA